MPIDKDTKLYGSFSGNPGNFGAHMMNEGFKACGINAIYKPFKVSYAESAIRAMRTLGIAGAGVSAPLKESALKWVDRVAPEADAIGSANTLLLQGEAVVAHNTDWLAAFSALRARQFLLQLDKLYILGNGGYARAIKYATGKLGYPWECITRADWHRITELKDCVVFNATPVRGIQVDRTCDFIDCHTDTPTGRKLALLQGKEQFKLYTGQDYPDELYQKILKKGVPS